jgi:hypothetical protein
MVVPVKWNFNLFVNGSQTLSLADKFDSTAYDKISVLIKADDKETEVKIFPGEIEDIDFFCIKSDKYTIDKTKQLTYKVGESTEAIVLDRAHMLIGNSMVGLLKEAPTKLIFNNTTGSDANLEIIVGRKATS